MRTVLVLSALVFVGALSPATGQTQDCTSLPDASKTNPVEAAPSTKFLPSGYESEIVLRKKYSEDLLAHVFEVDRPDVGQWKVLSRPSVISVKPVPERTAETSKMYGNFLASDSSVVRYIVPASDNSYWSMRTFVIRFCNQAGTENAWGIVRARVSAPTTAMLIAALVLALFYVLFAIVVRKIRTSGHPLEAKYPAVAPQRQYGLFDTLNPVILTANALNRGSIQKLQVLLFSFLVGGMLLSLLLRRGVLSDISVTVAALLGISAVGAAVAQKTTSSRDRLGFENWAWLVGKRVLPIREEDNVGPRWSDLVTTGREFDIYKLQTLIFSIVVAVALLVGGEDRIANFTVPETLLGILGLSQIAYVAGTLVSPPSYEELDKALSDLRQLESKLQTAVARNTDLDSDGKLPEPLPDPPAAPVPLPNRIAKAANGYASYKKLADRVEKMLESTLEIEVDRTRLKPQLV